MAHRLASSRPAAAIARHLIAFAIGLQLCAPVLAYAPRLDAAPELRSALCGSLSALLRADGPAPGSGHDAATACAVCLVAQGAAAPPPEWRDPERRALASSAAWTLSVIEVAAAPSRANSARAPPADGAIIS